MRSKGAISLLFLTLCVSGCDRADSNSPAIGTASPAKATTAAALSADPDSVKTCQPGKRLSTDLRWDVTSSGVEAVILTVVNPKDGSEKRFGHGGPVGSKTSGRWLRPGVVFKLRNQADYAELASVTIKGVACD